MVEFSILVSKLMTMDFVVSKKIYQRLVIPVIYVVYKTREMLLQAPINNGGSSDSIDIERSRLAALWRQEKLRIIDEYLESG